MATFAREVVWYGMVRHGIGAHGGYVVGTMEVVASRKRDDYTKLTDLSGQEKED